MKSSVRAIGAASSSSTPGRRAAANGSGRPVQLATICLSDAVNASRRERRELVLHALQLARAARRRRV